MSCGDLGTRVRQGINRSASLNNTRTSSRRNTRDKGGPNLQGTTLSFVASTDSLDDSGDGLGGFVVGQTLRVTGSMNNNRLLKVSSVAAGSVGVLPATVTDESAGALMDVRVV